MPERYESSVEADVAWIRSFLAERTGVQVPADRPDFVPGRLNSVWKNAKLEGLSALVSQLRGGNPSLIAATLDALTTHETSFFRDPDVYAWMENEGIPSLMQSASNRDLLIWSAACSTGQEPLGIAMLLADRWPTKGFRIYASDVSTVTVEKARAGIYPVLEVNRGLSARQLGRWFTRSGLDYRVNADLLSRISYQPHNLLNRGFPSTTVDMVTLRNVLIYLSPADREKVFHNIAAISEARGNRGAGHCRGPH